MMNDRAAMANDRVPAGLGEQGNGRELYFEVVEFKASTLCGRGFGCVFGSPIPPCLTC